MKNILFARYRSNLNEIVEAMGCRNPSRARKILNAYLTPGERCHLVMRWEIIRRLRRGIAYREIALALHLSTATVSRWALAEWCWRWRDA